MQKIHQILLIFLLLMIAAAGSLSNVFLPVDSLLRDVRFTHSSRPATGETVFLEINPESLQSVGVWPWPRHLYADAIRKLEIMGATEIVLDMDFSSASNAFDDASLEDALRRSGIPVHLAAVRGSSGALPARFALPLERFARHAGVTLTNIVSDPDMRVRSYPRGGLVAGRMLPTPASVLAAGPATAESFGIDFGIEAGSIDSIGLSHVLDDTVDPRRIAGHQIVVGVTGLDPANLFEVPRYGLLPGSMLHILAAETLKQQRALRDAGKPAEIGFAALLAVAFIVLQLRFPVAAPVGAAIAAALVTEAGAFVLPAFSGIVFDTAAIHLALIGFIAVALASEFDLRHFRLSESERDRDTTRSILKRVIADNFDGVIVVDDTGKIVAASRFAEEMLGFNANPANGDLIVDDVLPSELAAEVQVTLKMRDEVPTSPEISEATVPDKSGVPRTIEYTITVSSIVRDEGPGTAVACLTFRDVTERRASEKRLTYLAAHDPLTGALSRAKLIEIVNSTMASEDGRFIGMTIVLLDLSRFKAINDTLGHSYGDTLLKQVVERFKTCEVDCVARLGGDSFAAARAGVLSGKPLDRFCNQVLKTVSEVYEIGEHRAMIGAQLGVTNTDLSGYDPDTLISHADMALSAAKAMPANGYAIYRPEMDERLKEVQGMEAALRNAIAHGQFSLVYQPQVSLEKGELVGIEALMRWSHPELGMVPPGKFIPIAEETGIVVDLGRWVLLTACLEAASWPGDLTVSVNVSPMQFEFGDVIADVKAALEKSGLPPGRLDLEITEGVFIAQPQLVTQKLRDLKALGVGVALDDFGTGYSSLSYLSQLPIDKIKIDQAFVRGLPGDQHSAAIIRAVMTLSESLGKIVVAEGIENADQAWMLHLAGCQVGQGYYYGQPLSAREIAERINVGKTSFDSISAV